MAERSELLAESLCRVDVQEDRRLGEPVGDFGNRLLNAGFVVDLHHRDEQRVGPHRGRHAVGIHPTTGFRIHQRQVEAA